MLHSGVNGGNKKLAQVLDSRPGVGKWDVDRAMVVAKIALRCTELRAALRAQVSEVLEELEEVRIGGSGIGIRVKVVLSAARVKHHTNTHFYLPPVCCLLGCWLP
jgi:hypothetical protein